jgi:hypothetical protein
MDCHLATPHSHSFVPFFIKNLQNRFLLYVYHLEESFLTLIVIKYEDLNSDKINNLILFY